MKTILRRIKQIADSENIKITALERKIGASKGVLSRAVANETDIQSKWVQAIAENYPSYSAEWLLTGKGVMLRPPPPPEGAVREQVEEEKLSTPQETTYKKYCELLEQYVALQLKYATLLEKMNGIM
jgi:hypothetical protein